MLHASTQKLIDKLCDMTSKRQIEWREGDNDRSVFETEGYSVELSSEPVEIRLLHESGRELEKADTETLCASHDEDGVAYDVKVADMAIEAHRVAIGAEAAISSILTSLDKPRPVISPPSSNPIPQPAAQPAPASTELTPPIAASDEASMAAAVADMAEKLNSAEASQGGGEHAQASVVASDFSSAPASTPHTEPTPEPEPDEPAEWTAPAAANDQPIPWPETPPIPETPTTKLTSTGLAIGAGVGSFVNGLPEDVESTLAERADDADADTESVTDDQAAAEETPDKPYSPW